MKKLLLILISLLVIVGVGVATMFALNICPPKGPWPMPPWCKATFVINQYEVQTNASSLSQIKVVNMYDTWGRNYNMGMVETTQANLNSSFDRVKSLGAQEVFVHDFDRAVYEGEFNYKSTNYKFEDEIFANDMRDRGISKEEIKNLVDSAHERGMKLAIKRNLSFVNIGNFILSGIKGNISKDVQSNYEEFNSGHTEEWIRDFFAKWQARLVEKGKMYQEAGVDIMSVSMQFQNPTFAGHEELANSLWKNLIVELRKNFKGQIMVDLDVYGLTDGNNGKENWQKYDYYKDADIIEVRVYKILEKYQNIASDEVDVQKEMENMVQDLDLKAKEKGVKISIFFAPSSYVSGLLKGPVEFLDILNPDIKNLITNNNEQVNAFNIFFEAVKDKKNIERVNAGNFAWDDAMDPEVKPRISISASFRNKPAEQVIKAWFNK